MPKFLIKKDTNTNPQKASVIADLNLNESSELDNPNSGLNFFSSLVVAVEEGNKNENRRYLSSAKGSEKSILQLMEKSWLVTQYILDSRNPSTAILDHTVLVRQLLENIEAFEFPAYLNSGLRDHLEALRQFEELTLLQTHSSNSKSGSSSTRRADRDNERNNQDEDYTDDAFIPKKRKYERKTSLGHLISALTQVKKLTNETKESGDSPIKVERKQLKDKDKESKSTRKRKDADGRMMINIYKKLIDN